MLNWNSPFTSFFACILLHLRIWSHSTKFPMGFFPDLEKTSNYLNDFFEKSSQLKRSGKGKKKAKGRREVVPRKNIFDYHSVIHENKHTHFNHFVMICSDLLNRILETFALFPFKSSLEYQWYFLSLFYFEIWAEKYMKRQCEEKENFHEIKKGENT